MVFQRGLCGRWQESHVATSKGALVIQTLSGPNLCQRQRLVVGLMARGWYKRYNDDGDRRRRSRRWGDGDTLQ